VPGIVCNGITLATVQLNVILANLEFLAIVISFLSSGLNSAVLNDELAAFGFGK
jgi:hypothetical protein